jgi:hypothetical protein
MPFLTYMSGSTGDNWTAARNSSLLQHPNGLIAKHWAIALDRGVPTDLWNPKQSLMIALALGLPGLWREFNLYTHERQSLVLRVLLQMWERSHSLLFTSENNLITLHEAGHPLYYATCDLLQEQEKLHWVSPLYMCLIRFWSFGNIREDTACFLVEWGENGPSDLITQMSN